MSGWQRIGVVLSVLWLLGFPAYLLHDHNSRAQERTIDCVVQFTTMLKARGLNDEQIEKECRQYNDPASLLDALGMLVGRGWGQGLRNIEHFWDMGAAIIVWGPVVLLWLVGWIVFGTVRWVRRGFQKPAAK